MFSVFSSFSGFHSLPTLHLRLFAKQGGYLIVLPRFLLEFFLMNVFIKFRQTFSSRQSAASFLFQRKTKQISNECRRGSKVRVSTGLV